MLPYERETEMVKQKLAIADFKNVEKIMLDSKERRFTNVINYIEQITSNPQKKYSPQSLQVQLKFLLNFYKALTDQEYSIDENMSEILKQANSQQKLRVSVLQICIKLKKGQQIKQNYLKSFYALLLENPSLKQQILLKLIGCRNVQIIKDLTKQEIQDTTQNITKRALKYQIAADWKYFIGQQDQAIQFKQLAIKQWEKADKLIKTKQNMEELEQLTKICQKNKGKKKIEGAYGMKMLKLRQIIAEIQKMNLFLTSLHLNKRQRKKAVMRSLPAFLHELQQAQYNKNQIKPQLTSSSSISNSLLRKKGAVEERRQHGLSFYKQINFNNFAYVDFVPECRFERAQFRMFVQAIQGLLTYSRKLKQYAFLTMKMKYQRWHKINQQF